MNDTQRLEAMDSYFYRYRKTLNKLKQNEQDSQDLREKYEQSRLDLSNERTRITRELSNMRQVITKMIDEGCDPVMAGLVMNEDDHQSSIWEQRDNERINDRFGMSQDDITKRIGTITLPNINQITSTLQLNPAIQIPHGAAVATGAQGSTSMGPNGGYQQGYGAVPPMYNHPGVTADDMTTGSWTASAEL